MNSDQLPDAKLPELAQRLGAQAAERLDVERTAQAVVTRLRAAPPASATTWAWTRAAWVKIAATVVLVVGAGLVVRGLMREPPPTAVAVVPVAEDLSDLTAEQLRDALSSVDQPLSEQNAVDTGLDDLTADELRALLRTLEG